MRSARTAAAQALDRCYCLEIQYREVNLLFNKKMVDEFLIKRNLIGILSDKLSQSNQSLIEVIGNRDTLLSDLKATLSKSKEVGPLEYFEEDIDFMNSRLQVFSQHERHSEIRAEDRYNIPFDIPSYIFVDNLGAILKLENLSKQGFSVFSSQHEALSIGDKIGGKLMFHTRRPIHFKAQLRWVESDRFGCEIRKLNDEKGFESFMDLLLEGNRN